MRRFDYALFDLDGTLLDTREGVIAAAVSTMKRYGKTIPTESVLQALIGPPMQDSFRNLFGLTDDEAMEMANEFRNLYKMDEYLFQAVPYDGIYELMESLITGGVKIGIATYKREDYAKRLLCEKDFDKYTEYMYGSDLEGRLKKSDIIRNCLKDMSCNDFSKAVYIGDGNSDGKGAKEVGMPFIAVTYGFDFQSETDVALYNPIGVASNCNKLKKLLVN